MNDMDQDFDPSDAPWRAALRDVTPPPGARDAALRAAMAVFDELHAPVEQPATTPATPEYPANVIPLRRRHVWLMKGLTAAAAAIVAVVVVTTVTTRPNRSNDADVALRQPSSTSLVPVATTDDATEVAPNTTVSKLAPTPATSTQRVDGAAQPTAATAATAASAAAGAPPTPDTSAPMADMQPIPTTTALVATALSGTEALGPQIEAKHAEMGRVVGRIDSLTDLRAMVSEATQADAAAQSRTFSPAGPCPDTSLALAPGVTATYIAPVTFRGVISAVYLDSTGKIHLLFASTCAAASQPVPLAP